jgi:hypothetical protein
MTIKDKALSPYYIVSDYNGLHLYEEGSKQKLLQAQLNQKNEVIQDIVRRKMAAMEETVTLMEYNQREKALINTILVTMGEKLPNQQAAPMAMQEQIN